MRCLFLIVSMILITSSAMSKNKAADAANDELFKKLETHLGIDKKQLDEVRKVFKRNRFISQGNPEVSKYAMTHKQCMANGVKFENAEFRKICGAPYMAPLYDPKSQKLTDAKVCIDQFEFPSIPCEYPVVWTKAMDAVDICQAIGKRICDAHEWEGACAGRLTGPDYAFGKVKVGMTMNQKHKALRNAHNPGRKRLWSYGAKENHSLCGTKSFKSKTCKMNSKQSEWEGCGSNFYPVGAFPKCKSILEVYDIHGNAAEAMNIPFQVSELASRGGLGYTELKGSWYIFSNYKAHQDDCRWRAPFWHGATMKKSVDQHNHLGFRCCKDLK